MQWKINSDVYLALPLQCSAMDQSQTKALVALQPFVHLATTTKNPSPRFVSELVKSAISAPGTYVFTELLQTAACQSLRGTDSQAWLTLLEIFSWGTYEEYKGTNRLSPFQLKSATC